MKKQVGVIGSGNFGTALSVLLASNADVLMHTRTSEKAKSINTGHQNLGWHLPERIHATSNLEELCNLCPVIFIAIPSVHFSSLVQNISPFLNPRHIVVHGVKGFEIQDEKEKAYQINPHEELPVRTMSEVIKRETNVIRIGCLSGPNLSSELLKGLPAASVIASSYDEVILTTQKLLDQKTFKVYSSHHLKGTEFAGAFKNIIAIASGLVNGQDLGKNLESIIITKGLQEMLLTGGSLGIDPAAFLGLAGIGDLIATSTSPHSRNFRFGYALGKNNNAEDIMAATHELVEGISTTRIMYDYAKIMKLQCPVVRMVYDVIFNKKGVKESLDHIYEDRTSYDVRLFGDL